MKEKLTLLIYMAADNDLDEAGEEDLESLRRGSMDSDMTIVVQRDRWAFVDEAETVRYHIKEGEIFKEERLGETNTGDPEVLKAFIEESARAYPSEKLIVIIWSHGTGVDDFDMYTANRERYFVPSEEIEEIAIAFDDSAKDFLDNIELQKALTVDAKIDILGFDACLMGMFEIAYQLRNNAEVMVGSQHVEPASGWDYPRVLEELKLNSSSRQMGEELVGFYADFYEREGRYDTTQSALNLKVIKETARYLDDFAKLLLENLESKKDLKYTLLSSQLFNKNEYVDLVDFVHNAKARLEITCLDFHADKLLKSLELLIVANKTSGYGMRDAHGVSLYFPSQKRPFKETFEMYEKLEFSQDYPHWVELIKWYYA
jgi:hypothetical protein